jgi:hypothetical protein
MKYPAAVVLLSMEKTKKAATNKKSKMATWAIRELKAIQELFDDARCSPELRDKLVEAVWLALEK